MIIKYNGKQVLPVVLVYSQDGYYQDVSEKVDSHGLEACSNLSHFKTVFQKVVAVVQCDDIVSSVHFKA